MSLDLDARLALSPHAALKTRGDGDVLVLPERAIRLGGSGGEILRLCGEGHAGSELLAIMQARYPAEADMRSQVVAFLVEMLELGGIVLAGTREAREARGTS